LDTFQLIADIEEDELDIWRDAALLETDVAELQRSIDDYGTEMDTKERESIEKLVSAVGQAETRFNRTAVPRDIITGEAGKTLDAIALLRRIQVRREALLGRIEKATSPPSTSQSAKKSTRRATRPSAPRPV
jgi:hypothetical protein